MKTIDEMITGCEHDGSMIPVNEVKRLMESYQAQFEHPAIESLINRVEGLKLAVPLDEANDAWNGGIDHAREILRSQPVIRAKALRKKGTDKWYMEHSGRWHSTSNVLFSIMIDSMLYPEYPEDAELVNLIIMEE